MVIARLRKMVAASLLGAALSSAVFLVVAANGPAKAALMLDPAAADTAQALAPVEEQVRTTRNSLLVDGRKLAYRATAGTLTVRDTDGRPTASIFYTAYTLEGAGNVSRRPVTFLYNGGPGSASLQLHMGSFAPVRLRSPGPEPLEGPPYAFGPNPETLLASTDLVFIDAPATGYSRALGAAKDSDFFSFDKDVTVFADAIMRYLTINDRWNAPKFLLGESYGTARSAALAYELQNRGVSVNGVVLLSSVLNFGFRQPGYDQFYIGYFPTLAAIAWYHGRVADRPADLARFVQEARDFAVGPYASALAKGSAISPDEAERVAAMFSRFTGLSPDFVKSSSLRVHHSRFRKELLRDRGLTIGRSDGRYTGKDADAAGEIPENDPSATAIAGGYTASLQDYLTRELGYRTMLHYREYLGTSPSFKWDYSHRAPTGAVVQTHLGSVQPQADAALDLAAAMRVNPHLKILSLSSYYDLSTPFFATEYDLSHMPIDAGLRMNIESHYYASGHMTYLDEASLKALRKDIGGFIESVVSTNPK